MKCHILFSEKNKKNISKCRLLKILHRVLSVNGNLQRILDICLAFPMRKRPHFKTIEISKFKCSFF